jgi:uncharacterized repeat protein (TIGR01451 family)
LKLDREEIVTEPARVAAAAPSRVRVRMRALLALVALASAAAVVVAWPAAATPPQPSAGVADVDGVASEWDLGADFFADLRKSADPANPVAAKLYLRYDCNSRILYALVLTEPGIRLQTADATETYVRIDGTKIFHGGTGDNGSPPDFHWVDESGGTAGGFEGSGEVLHGSHELRVHAKIPANDADGYETIDIVGRTAPLVLSCVSGGSSPTTGGGTTPAPTPGIAAAAAPDVGIAKRVNPHRIQVNERATFTLTVTNSSGVPATGVTVTDTLPDRVAIVSVSTSRGTCSGTTQIVCQLGTLAPGDVVTITIVVVGAVPGAALNVAVVTINEADTNLANNRAEAVLEVKAPTGRDLPCYFLSARTKVLKPGKVTILRVTVRLAGKLVGGVKVVARGAGVDTQAKSNSEGVATLRIRPTKPGVVRISAVPARPPRSASGVRGECGLVIGLGVAGVTAEKRLTG